VNEKRAIYNIKLNSPINNLRIINYKTKCVKLRIALSGCATYIIVLLSSVYESIVTMFVLLIDNYIAYTEYRLLIICV